MWDLELLYHCMCGGVAHALSKSFGGVFADDEKQWSIWHKILIIFKKMTNFSEKNWGTYKLFVVPYIDFHFCPYSQLQKFSWLESNFSRDRINSNHQQAYKLLVVADHSIFRIVFPWTKLSDLATDRYGSWCRMLQIILKSLNPDSTKKWIQSSLSKFVICNILKNKGCWAIKLQMHKTYLLRVMI